MTIQQIVQYAVLGLAGFVIYNQIKRYVQDAKQDRKTEPRKCKQDTKVQFHDDGYIDLTHKRK